MKNYSINPRKITDSQRKALKESLSELGDISGIVHDLETDEIICGNQRLKAIEFQESDLTVVERFDHPQDDGTVLLGYINKDGVFLNYRAVRFSEYERSKASLSANKLGGEFDENKLDLFDDVILNECGFSKVEVPDEIINRQLRMQSEVTVTIGVFSFTINRGAFDRYCEYLREKDENTELIDLFLKEVGL